MQEHTLEELTQKFPVFTAMPIPETPELELDEVSNGKTVSMASLPELDEASNGNAIKEPEAWLLPPSAPLSSPQDVATTPVKQRTAKEAKKQAKAAKKQQNLTLVASHGNAKQEQAKAHLFQERCHHLCLSIFFQEQMAVRSLGFTSSVNGEGKSFLATVSARALANDSNFPITLLECNWEHPGVDEYFGIAPSPGLAEWLRGEASESAIRHQVGSNLTVIPAGNGRQDAVRLVQQMRQNSFLATQRRREELFIVDLPPVITTAYGSMMASLVDALIIVVRAKVTPEALIAETCTQLKDMPVRGTLLNQVETNIPRWIRQLL